MDEISARRFSLPNSGGGGGGILPAVPRAAPVDDFASFMMAFNDMFMGDEFYTDFGMTDDVMTSNVIGSGTQFEAKLVRLPPDASLRTSSDPATRLTEGRVVVLKRPRLTVDLLTGRFAESGTIASIVNELRVISHPALRHHPNVLDVYGFAWENEEDLAGISVWPIIMVEYGDLGTLDQCLTARLEPLDLDTKLRLAGGIARGVDALHKCRIIHSDLKPGNIMVVEGSDGNPIAKLSDFGYSIILDDRTSPSPWEEGTFGWMAPEWRTPRTNEQLFSTDVYGCGLLLWCILLDGKAPWSLDTFSGAQNKLLTFESAKREGSGLINLALASVLESSEMPDERADEIGDILSSLLALAPEERSLEPLLRYQDDLQPPDNFARLALKSTAGRVSEDRPIFPDYIELQRLSPTVKRQILDSISKIGLDVNQSLHRRADACYTVAMLHLLRCGTVRPRDGQETEYIGYEIGGDEVMCWLSRAASLGSPSAQAVYYPIRQALGTYISETRGRNFGEDGRVDVPEYGQIVTWLANATALGSDIASSALRELDRPAWESAQQLLKHQYCGVGRALFDEATTNRVLTLSPASMGNVSISQEVSSAEDTALHLASTMGREDVVRSLCSGASHADINRQNSRGETALLQATRSGHLKIARFLLSVGASAGLVTENDENPLHWLASLRDEDEKDVRDLAEAMVESGAKLEQWCSDNTLFNPYFSSAVGPGTPLSRAVQRNAYAAAKILLGLGADPYYNEDGNHNFPMALACSLHNTPFIGLFLEHPVRLPGWHGKPGFFDAEHGLEVFMANMRKEKTYQSAAPNAWKSMNERGTENSLLGYVVSPRPIHVRMALHGAQYLHQMQLAVQAVAGLDTQNFSRVSWDYQSALMYSVSSRDLSLVSYLLENFPEESKKALTNPVPTSEGAKLPVQLALILGEWPIFDALLRAAGGPSAQVSVTNMEGVTDNWFAKATLWLIKGRPTLASQEVSHSFANLVHLATASHPDPRFMEAILSGLDPDEARRLVNSHGCVDELPLSMAALRHFFAVADVLIRYGADVEEEGNKPPGGQGFAQSCLGVVLTFNNHGAARTVSWMLHHPRLDPSFIVNKRHGMTALAMAIRAGGAFEVSPASPLLPVRLYREDTRLLEIVLRHFCARDPALVNRSGFAGMTALHWAVMRLQPGAAALLLAAGADPELRMNLPGGDRTVTAREMAMGFDEDTIPPEVKERGPEEVGRFLRRFEELRRVFTDV